MCCLFSGVCIIQQSKCANMAVLRYPFISSQPVANMTLELCPALHTTSFMISCCELFEEDHVHQIIHAYL